MSKQQSIVIGGVEIKIGDRINVLVKNDTHRQSQYTGVSVSGIDNHGNLVVGFKRSKDNLRSDHPWIPGPVEVFNEPVRKEQIISISTLH